MKKLSFILAAAALLMAGNSADAKSFKRGVSENQFSLYNQMVILEPGVSWYYNWSNVPGKGYENQVIDFTGFDFIPMVWNGSYSADNIREYAKGHPECKYLLGFNEPNFTAQANLTPSAAAALWPDVQALAKELGLKLVAPALNYSPNAPYQDPTKWMDEFVALVGSDAFDYVAIHNYGGLGVMKTLAGTFHEKYGKDVWVTEFCYWPDEGSGNSRVEPTAQIASMVETVEWLEKTPWIYRYAWFKAVGRHVNTATVSSPCYGLIITENGLGEKTLSPQGYVYTYLTDFDENVWHPIATEICAADYINQSLSAVYQGYNESAPKPIEISQFNSGAWLEYQFDIPETDDYNITLTVSGQGEPVRFDPQVQAQLVDGDKVTALCTTKTLQLSGSDTEYTTQQLTAHLEAGHRTIRIADMAPYQPSGMHISSIRIDYASGVSDVAVDAADENPDAATYTIDGRLVNGRDLAPGIYIRNNRKFIVR
jgi:hypothetical protein